MLLCFIHHNQLKMRWHDNLHEAEARHNSFFDIQYINISNNTWRHVKNGCAVLLYWQRHPIPHRLISFILHETCEFPQFFRSQLMKLHYIATIN